MRSLPATERARRGLGGPPRVALCCANMDMDHWENALSQALPGFSVVPWPCSAPDADYAVAWTPPQAFLDSLASPRAIFNVGAGVDGLLRMRLPPGSLIVRIEDGGMAVQMAEYVCHAVIRHFREFDAYAARTRAEAWQPLPPRRRADFPVGVMGLGALGERVAASLRQFDFPVLGWSRTRKSLESVRCHAGLDEFEVFLKETRILVCMLPLTPETQNLMNRRSLSLLQPGGYVINVARGSHFVEEDLVELLDSGQLAGATLDVFRTEPLPRNHPFWRHPRITMTPHIAAQTLINEAVAQISGKIARMEKGESVPGTVDRILGY